VIEYIACNWKFLLPWYVVGVLITLVVCAVVVAEASDADMPDEKLNERFRMCGLISVTWPISVPIVLVLACYYFPFIWSARVKKRLRHEQSTTEKPEENY